MNRNYLYQKISTTDDVREYLHDWNVPCIIENSPNVIKVKVPASSLPQAGMLVKCNSSPEFSLRLVFEKMTIRERLLNIFS